LRQHEANVEDLCRRIGERAQSITMQLGSPQEAIEFTDSGIARLSGWAPRVTRGAARFEHAEVDGTKLLQIRMVQGGGTASWRAHVQLDPGQYRFEGRVRTEDAGGSGSVRLRISGSQSERHSDTDGEWSLLSYTFEADEPVVVLVCEFEGRRGQAWFDAASLRLVRE
jgi:hypothetical protein